MKSKNLRFKTLVPVSELLKIARKEAIKIGRGGDLISIEVGIKSFKDSRAPTKEIVIQMASVGNCLRGSGTTFQAALKNLYKDLALFEAKENAAGSPNEDLGF